MPDPCDNYQRSFRFPAPFAGHILPAHQRLKPVLQFVAAGPQPALFANIESLGGEVDRRLHLWPFDQQGDGGLEAFDRPLRRSTVVEEGIRDIATVSETRE